MFNTYDPNRPDTARRRRLRRRRHRAAPI